LWVLPEYPAEFWPCAVVAVIMVGIAKAGFGGGVGIVATPLMALAVTVTEAAALMLPLLMACDLFAVRHYRTSFDRRSIKLLLPGALIGVGVGAFFFGYFANNPRALQSGLGYLALIFVLFHATRSILFTALQKRRPAALEGILMGVISGFTSTLAHAGGPPATMYLLPQKFSRHHFVGTTVIFFAALNIVKLVPYIALGFMRPGILLTTLILSPLSYVGVKLGIYLNGRFSELWFNRLVYGLLLVTGLQLVLGTSLLSAILP
jgi:uncharacterized membrane protein YfcA